MLDVQSLASGYRGRLVLEEVTFSVERGEVVALIGPNGAGKTTLMRTLSGVLKATSGRVLLDGEDAASLSPARRAAKIAVVPQARELPADFSVWQTVLLGRTPYLGWLGRIQEEDRRRAAQAIERAGLQGYESRPVGELSGGEQQRVLLARALAQETPILLLDEPTSNLDLKHQSVLLNLVRRQAHQRAQAALMAVHDLNLAAIYADRIILLAGGRLQACGTPEQVLRPEILQQAYQVPVRVMTHPDYGTPLVLPDGKLPDDRLPSGNLPDDGQSLRG